MVDKFTASDARELANTTNLSIINYDELKNKGLACLPERIEKQWLPTIFELAGQGLYAADFSVASSEESTEACRILEKLGYETLSTCFSQHHPPMTHNITVVWY